MSFSATGTGPHIAGCRVEALFLFVQPDEMTGEVIG